MLDLLLPFFLYYVYRTRSETDILRTERAHLLASLSSAPAATTRIRRKFSMPRRTVSKSLKGRSGRLKWSIGKCEGE
jgi:hypothetical protein